MNYRLLLKRYMALVWDQEGVHFIEAACYDSLPLSDEEKKELLEIAAECGEADLKIEV